MVLCCSVFVCSAYLPCCPAWQPSWSWPVCVQVYTCDQVLSYLRQFVVVEKAAVEEKKAVDAPAPGMKLLNKKTLDAEADALWGSVQAKKGKGARKAAEKQKAAEAVKVGGGGSGWQHWVVVVVTAVVLGWVDTGSAPAAGQPLHRMQPQRPAPDCWLLHTRKHMCSSDAVLTCRAPAWSVPLPPPFPPPSHHSNCPRCCPWRP